MAYTKVNLKEDVQDSAPSFGFAPDMEARFASGDLELEQSGAGYERLAPNFRVPFGHTHKGQEELYVVVAGSGRMKIDDEIVVHTIVELYARSPEEATEVLENASRGELTITSLAEESRPPASTGGDSPH